MEADMTESTETYDETSKEFELRIIDAIQRQMNQGKGDPRAVWVLTD